MVRHQRVDGAVLQTGPQGVAVALLAQGRVQASAAVKVANISVGQVQGVDADVARHPQTVQLGLTHQRHTCGTADAAQMHAGAGGAHQLKNSVQGNGFSNHGHTAQPHAGGQRATGGHAFAQVKVLRAQPNGIVKGAGVLQRTLQHLGIGQRHFGLAKGHTASIGQLGHLGQRLAGQIASQGAQRVDAGLVELFSPKAQHFHQTGLIQHGVGIGQAHQAGDATSHSSRHLRGEHVRVLQTGLAQAHRQIHQTGGDDAARGVDNVVGLKVRCYSFNS